MKLFLAAALLLPVVSGAEDAQSSTKTSFLRKRFLTENTCIAPGANCFQTTLYELDNPYGGCCDVGTTGYRCLALNDPWWATCEEILPGYVFPFPDPLGPIDYIPLAKYDTCPAGTANLGPLLSASTEYQQDFPLLGYQDLANPVGRDDAIAFFVKGTYTSEFASEIEGKIVVLEDFIVNPRGVNTLANSGLGSGIVPNDDQVVMTVGRDIKFYRDEDTWVLAQTPGGGDVAYGGENFDETGPGYAGELKVKGGRQISQDLNIDTQSYLDMFDELAIKSEYWSTLEPNGIIYPAVQTDPVKNPKGRLVFSAADDGRCLQVFHADRFDLHGLNGIDVEFDPSLAGKTILINVASTYNSTSGKKEVVLDNWGKMYDTSGLEHNDRDFQSSTKASILWNFYDADVVSMGPGGGVQFPGSILIPNGDLYFYWPGHDGRLIVGGDVWQEREGSEFHNYEFDPPCGLPECMGTPLPAPPCPEDIILISQIGETSYPAIPIRIVEQNVGTVTFQVVNTFYDQVDSIYTQYHIPPVGGTTCVETTFVDTNVVAEYTAHCLRSDPITIVQVWVSDGSLSFVNDTAVVDDCCEPTPDVTVGKVQYTFQIRCVSECPEIAR